ncbi:uncharacterized protein EI97DRAFT_445299 [Westerdykella ornata]|uniref:Mid2 domain-containing protein n=1 Tax=Westerdykella ornata TaxID=318751 RepID=A0A6A6J9F3_WESOR|nr:uncharacterized protein EI97DRAFT_445299 [Westerdykella ornata]KAF2273022.1 hypothetical protein EI97DRAFT_445299 [Westerdykella ornata]
MSPFFNILLPLFLSTLATAASAASDRKCYSLNGTELDSTFRPCNPNAQHSGCCATNRRTGSPDICLDSGLCMVTGGEYVGTIWQAGCTDPSGRDKGCPRVCPVDASSSPPSTPPPLLIAWNIQPCDLGTYCCRTSTDRRSCCANPSAAKFQASSLGSILFPPSINNAVTEPSPSPSLSSANPNAQDGDVRATARSTGSPISLSTTPTNPPSDSPLSDCPSTAASFSSSSNTAKITGAVGGTLGFVIICLCALLFWMYKCERRQRRLKEHYEEQFGQNWAWRRTVVVGSEEGLVRSGSEKGGEENVDEVADVEEGAEGGDGGIGGGRKAGEGRRVG